MSNLSSCYEEGRVAYYCGLHFTANPYAGEDRTTTQYEDWHDGWAVAQYEDDYCSYDDELDYDPDVGN